jgi:hypothetical protein
MLVMVVELVVPPSVVVWWCHQVGVVVMDGGGKVLKLRTFQWPSDKGQPPAESAVPA